VELGGDVYVLGGADVAGTAINRGRVLVLPAEAIP
jgi:hypothetical protein